MSYVNFLGAVGDVSNVDVCLEIIRNLTGEENIDIKFINSYHEHVSNGKRYFNGSVKEISYGSESANEKAAQYIWVDTGYKTRNGETIYASFYKTPLGWSGAYIGAENKLFFQLSKYLHKGSSISLESAEEVQEEEVKRDPLIDSDSISFGSYFTETQIIGGDEAKKIADALNNNKFCISLYTKLLNKENWATPKENANRLIKYIDSIACKVQREMKAGSGNGYITNGDGRAVVFNSGLLDYFMNDIYVIFDVNIDYTFCNPRVVESKTDLLKIGFSKEDIRVMTEPVKFYKKKEELVFNGSLEDFNFDNRANLHHIINERRSRFPEKLRNISENLLCDKLKLSIENAVRMSKRDYKYIVPMYNSKHDFIQYLVPLYIEKSIVETPELVLVIGEISGFYEVMTILNPDDAYDNARLLSIPDSGWLKPTNANVAE